MKLRERFVVTLVVIAVILAAPAAVAVQSLRNLKQDIVEINVRNAARALQLGRLQAAFRDMSNSERIVLALANSQDSPQFANARLMVAESQGKVEVAFDTLSTDEYANITEYEALDGFSKLARLEGIIPALESAHAIAYVLREGRRWRGAGPVVVCLSGRGDKDVALLSEHASGGPHP